MKESVMHFGHYLAKDLREMHSLTGRGAGLTGLPLSLQPVASAVGEVAGALFRVDLPQAASDGDGHGDGNGANEKNETDLVVPAGDENEASDNFEIADVAMENQIEQRQFEEAEEVQEVEEVEEVVELDEPNPSDLRPSDIRIDHHSSSVKNMGPETMAQVKTIVEGLKRSPWSWNQYGDHLLSKSGAAYPHYPHSVGVEKNIWNTETGNENFNEPKLSGEAGRAMLAFTAMPRSSAPHNGNSRPDLTEILPETYLSGPKDGLSLVAKALAIQAERAPYPVNRKDFRRGLMTLGLRLRWNQWGQLWQHVQQVRLRLFHSLWTTVPFTIVVIGIRLAGWYSLPSTLAGDIIRRKVRGHRRYTGSSCKEERGLFTGPTGEGRERVRSGRASNSI